MSEAGGRRRPSGGDEPQVVAVERYMSFEFFFLLFLDFCRRSSPLISFCFVLRGAVTVRSLHGQLLKTHRLTHLMCHLVPIRSLLVFSFSSPLLSLAVSFRLTGFTHLDLGMPSMSFAALPCRAFVFTRADVVANFMYCF